VKPDSARTRAGIPKDRFKETAPYTLVNVILPTDTWKYFSTECKKREVRPTIVLYWFMKFFHKYQKDIMTGSYFRCHKRVSKLHKTFFRKMKLSEV